MLPEAIAIVCAPSKQPSYTPFPHLPWFFGVVLIGKMGSISVDESARCENDHGLSGEEFVSSAYDPWE
jgi:hypothetical protein